MQCINYSIILLSSFINIARNSMYLVLHNSQHILLLFRSVQEQAMQNIQSLHANKTAKFYHFFLHGNFAQKVRIFTMKEFH